MILITTISRYVIEYFSGNSSIKNREQGVYSESRYLELSSDQVRDSSGYSRKRDFEIARFNKFYK